MVRHTGVHGRDARDVDHDDLGAVDPDATEQLLGELTSTLRVDDADDRKDQQSLAHGQDRSRELADRFLLLADDPLAPPGQSPRLPYWRCGWRQAHRRPGRD